MYQRRRHCKIRGDFTSNATTRCAENQTYANESDIEVEIYSIYLMKAMYAFIYGFMEFKAKDEKGFQRTKECATALRNSIKNITIPTSDNEIKEIRQLWRHIFNLNGDGQSGYQVHNLQYMHDNNSVKQSFYQTVYAFDENDTLSKVQNTSIKFYRWFDKKEVIIGQLLGIECLIPPTTPTDNLKGINVPLYVGIAIAVVIIVILILLLVISNKGWISNLSTCGGELSHCDTMYNLQPPLICIEEVK